MTTPSNNNNNNPLSRIQVNRNNMNSSSAARRARWEQKLNRGLNEMDAELQRLDSEDDLLANDDADANAASEAGEEAREADAVPVVPNPVQNLAIYSSNQIVTDLHERFPQFSFAELEKIFHNYINNKPQRNRITRQGAMNDISEQLSRNQNGGRRRRKSRKHRKNRRNTRRNRF